MGLAATGSKFWYIQCDRLNCGKMLHQYSEEILKQSARLLGWGNEGNEWICPSCVEKRRKRKGRSSESSHKISHDLTA